LTIKKFLAYALGPIGGAVLSLISLPILAWMFSPDDIGRYAMVHIAISLSFLLCSLGLEQAYVREYYERADTAALLKTTCSMGFLIAGILIICILSFGTYVSNSLFEIKSKTLAALIAICIGSHFITNYSLLILRMAERALFYSLISLSHSVFFLISALYIYFFQPDKDFTSLFFAYTLSSVIATLVSVWICKIEWINAFNANFLLQDVTRLLKFSSPLIIAGISYWGLSSFDRVGLRYLSTFDQLGLFSIAASFAGAASIVSRIFSTIWTPFIYKWNKNGIEKSEYNSICEKVLLLVTAAYITAGTFSWTIRFILPPTYYDAVHMITACMGAPFFYILSETTVVGTHLSRKSFYSMFASIGGLLTAVILVLLMVPQFGAAGAASATCIAFLVFLILRTEFSIIAWKQIPRKKLYSLSLIFTCLSVAQALIHEPIGNCFFAIWGLMYTLIFILFKHQLKEILVAVLNRNK
jgi:O-antigen/teichoic acid export membrane protein